MPSPLPVMLHHSLLGVIALGSIFGLSGCASVSVVSWSENRGLRPSPPIGGLPLEASVLPPLVDSRDERRGGDTLILDRESGHSYRHSQERVEMFSALDKSVEKATEERWKKISPSVGNSLGLLLDGQILEADHGSRWLRSIVGLGLGRTRLSGRFYVYNREKSLKIPWLTIHTSGGTNREPGVIWSFIPGPSLPLNIIGGAGAILTVSGQVSKGLSADASRTGRVLANFIADRSFLREGEATAKLAGRHRLPLVGEIRLPGSRSPRISGETLFLE